MGCLCGACLVAHKKFVREHVLRGEDVGRSGWGTFETRRAKEGVDELARRASLKSRSGGSSSGVRGDARGRHDTEKKKGKSKLERGG